MLRVVTSRMLLAMMLFMVVSCSQDKTVGPDEYIQISVSEGTLPTFSWQGGPAHRLTVEKLNAKVVWAVQTPQADSLFSPTKLGEIPESAVIVIDTLVVGPVDTLAYGQPLTPGEEYLVRISRHSTYAIGTLTFVP